MISDEHLEHWQHHGYTIVERWLDGPDLEAARSAFHQVHPTWREYRDDPDRWPDAAKQWLIDAFPHGSVDLSLAALHHDLVDFATRALGTDDLLVAHADAVGKYAGSADFDQQLHVDYGNNTMLVPPEAPEMVPFIWYLEDATADLGPTHIVSRKHTADIPLSNSKLPREEFPEVYEHEQAVTVPAGSLVIYTMRTYHRGSAMTATSGIRASHHLTLMRGNVRWAGWRSFAVHASQDKVKELIERATPRQRSLLGIPAPKDPFWTTQTLADVATRYPEGDWWAYGAE